MPNGLDVVVVELRKLEVEEDRIGELVKLPSSTPIVLMAAVDLAKKRPAQFQAGKAVQLIRDPSKIPPAALKRAEAKLQAVAAAAESAKKESEAAAVCEQGHKIVAEMSDEKIVETHALLIQHYRDQQNATAVEALEKIHDPRISRDFWRAVGKNKSILSAEPALTHTGDADGEK